MSGLPADRHEERGFRHQASRRWFHYSRYTIFEWIQCAGEALWSNQPASHHALDASESRDMDSNLISRTGVKIQSDCTFDGSKLKEEVVTVDFSKFKSTDYEPLLEAIAQATLECIRRTATDDHQKWPRPVLKIIGKPADEAMWKLWVEEFNKQDFSKPFKRPQSLQKDAKSQR